jgi:signal transduction histidine kinase
MPFHSISDPVKLTRVIEATMLLQADIELPVLLGHVVEEARSLTGARYGALGIFNPAGTAIDEFLTVGLTLEEEARIGPRPAGKGVLGLQLTDPTPLRLAHLGEHPQSVGFPAEHPPMDSFLGVRVEVRGEIYGSLYLTDKVGLSSFTEEDQALVEALAVAAGMAIENNRLHTRIQEAAVIDDRNRTARDLHDTVVQHLYAVGISLETLAHEADSAALADRLEVLVSDIGGAIRQVRSSIYELGVDEEDPGVRASVLTLVRSLAPMLGFVVRVTFDGPVDSVISQSVAEQLLATIREAVTNIGRHARATEASVTVSAYQGLCRLTVVDNGIGIDGPRDSATGLGLMNLRRRAERLHGTMTIASSSSSSSSGGTVLDWSVPFSQ